MMGRLSQQVHDKGCIAPALAMAALGVAALFGAVVCVLPSLDITVASLFYGNDHEFVGNESAAVGALRQAFKLLCVTFCVAAVVGLALTRGNARTWLGLRFVHWLFLVICLALGPGIVANLILKDHWGRARPYQIAEFGGVKTFTPALKPADQCDRNCSFVSGEASAIFAPFFAVAVLYRRRAPMLLALGLTAGTLDGLVRMSQGGHFLSDVVFAGVLMALTTVVVDFIFQSAAQVDGAQNWTSLGTLQHS